MHARSNRCTRTASREVQPTRAMVAALGVAYIRSAAPGALECIAALRAAEVRVVIVSGGLRQGLLPLARHLGVAADDVHAVEIRFDEQGEYAGLAGPQPLATQTGKRKWSADSAWRRPCSRWVMARPTRRCAQRSLHSLPMSGSSVARRSSRTRTMCSIVSTNSARWCCHDAPTIRSILPARPD